MLPLADLSRRSPELRAKADPYSNKTHKRIDILLLVVTLALMIFAFRASAQYRPKSDEPTRAAQTGVQR